MKKQASRKISMRASNEQTATRKQRTKRRAEKLKAKVAVRVKHLATRVMNVNSQLVQSQREVTALKDRLEQVLTEVHGLKAKYEPKTETPVEA